MRSAVMEGKLTTSDRKKLDEDVFGLPDERKYPLNDEGHVRKAIQFFKFCPTNKRAILAKNINKKIKEFDMKIEVSEDNPFYTYANRLTIKVKEAFMPDNNDIDKEEINIIRNYKVFKEADMVALELLCVSIINEYFEDRVVHGVSEKDYMIEHINDEMNDKYSDFIQYLYPYEKTTEFASCDVGYRLCESACYNAIVNAKENKPISEYIDIIENHSNKLHAYRCICEALMSIDIAIDDSDSSKIGKFSMINLCKDRLYDKIKKETNHTIRDNIDIYDNKYKCLPIYGNELRSLHNQINKDLYIINTDNNIESPKDFYKFNSYNKLYSDILSYSFNPSIFCPPYLTTELDIRDLMILNNTFNSKIKIIQNMDANGNYMYFGMKDDDKDNAVVFFKHKSNEVYFTANIMNNAELLMALSVEGYGKPHISIQPIKVKTMMVETTEALKSVDINKNGDIKIEIAPNKSYMDSYSENHKLLVENYKNKNYDAMKENLSFVFALISIIERSDEYKRRDTEAVKARAFAMNDFKTYLGHIQRVEPKFDFARYYIDSDYDKKIINVPKTTIIGVKNLIKALIV